MKKRGILAIIVLILLSSIVLAESKIRFQHIGIDDYVKPGTDLFIQTTIENTGGKSLSNLKISAYLIGTDIRDTKISDKIIIGETETTTLSLYLDNNIEPGLYYLRISAQDSHIRRIKYREVIII